MQPFRRSQTDPLNVLAFQNGTVRHRRVNFDVAKQTYLCYESCQ